MTPNPKSPLQTVLCLTMNPAVDLATDTETVQPTHKLRCSPTRHDAGGGGINVARVITRLGGPCTALCPVGGSTGQWLRLRMAEEGIPGIFLPMAGDTRISFTVHERRSDDEFRFVMPGPTLTEAEWTRVLDHLSGQHLVPDLLVASGSLPPGVPDDFYARLARSARARGSRVVLDTGGPALREALHEGVYLVKPNLRELSEWVGRPLETPEEWITGARALRQQGGAEVVALTLGHQGALLVTAAGAWHAPALPIHVASTVGAGDSFVGAMVWALQRGENLQEAFAWGVAAGSAALLHVGTGLCQPTDIARLRPQVELRLMASWVPEG